MRLFLENTNLAHALQNHCTGPQSSFGYATHVFFISTSTVASLARVLNLCMVSGTGHTHFDLILILFLFLSIFKNVFQDMSTCEHTHGLRGQPN